MLLGLDFETYYDKSYQLKQMTTEHYVRDPRFEPTGLGLATEGGSYWVPPTQIEDVLCALDWTQIELVCHNAQFDAFILYHHFGLRPTKVHCTLSLARLLFPNERHSLEKLAMRHLGSLKSVPYGEMLGVRLAAMPPDLVRRVGEGAQQDAALCLRLFLRWRALVPEQELTMLDWTIRMFTEPLLVGNAAELRLLEHREVMRLNELLERSGVDAKTLSSNEKFATFLTEWFGLEVPEKEGKPMPDGTPRWNPCVAASDQFMRDLLEDDDEEVQAVAQARIQAKSRITGTRAGMLAGMAERGPGRALPVFLHYAGARRTIRWSGGDRVNWQNFPRSGELGECIEAPEGHMLVICDAAQIEYRILCFVAGEQWPLDRFRTGADLYCEFGTEMYGRTITKADKLERYIGKKGVLSSGYGIGARMFLLRLKADGMDDMCMELAELAVGTYRRMHPHVKRMWQDGDIVVRRLAAREPQPMTWLTGDILAVEHDRIWLPNDTFLDFQITWDAGRGKFIRRDARGASPIWGGALTGEIVQSLARAFFTDVLDRIGVRPVWLRHDEAVWVVPNHLVEPFERHVETQFRQPPDWLAGIPLDCECWASKNYAKRG